MSVPEGPPEPALLLGVFNDRCKLLKASATSSYPDWASVAGWNVLPPGGGFDLSMAAGPSRKTENYQAAEVSRKRRSVNERFTGT